MSLPGYQFTCTKCDYRFFTSGAPVIYSYQMPDGNRVQAPTDYGWCGACQTVEEIQCGLSTQQLLAECAKLKTELARKPHGFFAWLFGRYEYYEALRWKSYLQREENLLTLLAGRDSLAKCITCSSLDVQILSFPQGYHIERQQLPYEHRGCGGNLIVSQGLRASYSNGPRTKILELAFSSS